MEKPAGNLASGNGEESIITSPAVEDPFGNLESLRLTQDFESSVGVKKLLTVVPVRKPSKQDFIRVHPSSAYRLETAVLELKDDRETYLVGRTLWEALPEEISPRVLLTCVNRQGVLSLWPVRLPGADGRTDNWSRSALDAAQRALQAWVRIIPNMSLGGYECYQAAGAIAEPVWPELTFSEILRIAFQDRYIDSFDHPVLRRLRGE
jgi:hypothetical protein